MEMGCGDSTEFPFLFQVFIWPRETSAVLRQKHIPTLVKLSRDGTQLCMRGLLLGQSPPLKVRERLLSVSVLQVQASQNTPF